MRAISKVRYGWSAFCYCVIYEIKNPGTPLAVGLIALFALTILFGGRVPGLSGDSLPMLRLVVSILGLLVALEWSDYLADSADDIVSVATIPMIGFFVLSVVSAVQIWG